MKRPFASIGIATADVPEVTRLRFVAKIERHDEDCSCCGGCWHWRGARTPQGYGQFRLSGRSTTAQRVAYAIFVGDLAPGLTIDHLCRNRACVNPAHLEAVPHRVNILRGGGAAAQHARRTHCKRGHVLVQGRTQRYCPICKRETGRVWMRQRRARLRREARAAA